MVAEPIDPARAALERYLERFRGVNPFGADSRPVGELAPSDCASCSGRRWVRPNLTANPGDPAFGKYVPCPDCLAPELHQRAIDRAFSGSGLDEPYLDGRRSWDTYAARPNADPNALAEARRLAAGTPTTAYFYGGMGVMKSGLVQLIIREWISAGATGVLFVVAPVFLQRIRDGYTAGAEVTAREVVAAATNADVLGFDDLAAGRIRTDDGGEWIRGQLLDLIDWRTRKALPTLYTSNYAPEDRELEDRIGDRTASRLAEHIGERVIWVGGVDQRRVRQPRVAS